jgi:hypothetical protein
MKENYKTIIAVLPLKDKETNILDIENAIIDILRQKIDREKENIKFPVRI